MAVLYRCKTPTDLVCRCGKVARTLRAMGVDYEEVRVPFLKRDRPEVFELTGQRWVPVLVHGKEVVADSHRIVEYLERLHSAASAPELPDAKTSARRKAAGPAKALPVRAVMRSSRAGPKR